MHSESKTEPVTVLRDWLRRSGFGVTAVGSDSLQCFEAIVGQNMRVS